MFQPFLRFYRRRVLTYTLGATGRVSTLLEILHTLSITGASAAARVINACEMFQPFLRFYVS